MADMVRKLFLCLSKTKKKKNEKIKTKYTGCSRGECRELQKKLYKRLQEY